MTDDDDICSNPFFTALLSANRVLLSEAAAKGALVCVPKTGTCPVESMRQLDHRSHVISQSPFFVGMYDSLDSRQVTYDLSYAALGLCLLQLSVDGHTITTGRGYPDIRSVRIEREDILYGYAAQPSTPLRVLLISAPLTGSIIETAPKDKVDTSGQALLLLADKLVVGQTRARCMSKTGELKQSYVMVKTFEHLLCQKLDAIVAECVAMLQAGSVSDGSNVTLEMQQACLRCFLESVVHEHIMQSLSRLWADEVARFSARCDAIKATDVSLPPPPPAATVLHHLSSLRTACCFTQKAELFQKLLDAILLCAGAAEGGASGVISTDDLLPFIIAFVCAHARDGTLLLHVVFCDCLQHTYMAHGEWGFTLSLFKSAVVYVAAYDSGSSSSNGTSAGSAVMFSKGAPARKNSVTSLAAALGNGSGSVHSSSSSGGGGGGNVQEPQSVPPYRRSSLTSFAPSFPVASCKTVSSSSSNSGSNSSSSSSSSSSLSRPPAVIVPDSHVKMFGQDDCNAGVSGGAAADRLKLGSFLSSLLDDD
jgi:hypothetical protein